MREEYARWIRDVSVAQGGFDQAASLERLPQLVDKMLAFLDATITRRDPHAIPREEAPQGGEGEVPAAGAAPAAATPGARGPLASVGQADDPARGVGGMLLQIVLGQGQARLGIQCAGRDFRLTDVSGRVLTDLIA